MTKGKRPKGKGKGKHPAKRPVPQSASITKRDRGRARAQKRKQQEAERALRDALGKPKPVGGGLVWEAEARRWSVCKACGRSGGSGPLLWGWGCPLGRGGEEGGRGGAAVVGMDCQQGGMFTHHHQPITTNCPTTQPPPEGGLNFRAVLETAADVAKALVHLHAHNVLHADLKCAGSAGACLREA
jgi:hypothetical protein